MDWNEFFYVRPEDVTDEYLTLQEDELHHLKNIYRKKAGDTFSAVDGMGCVYECQIEQLHRAELKARITRRDKLLGEPRFQLTTALAIPKKGRFEWLIEKGTEIGISEFIPVLTERTVAKDKSVDLNRCKRIALAAMKQCRRSRLPRIAEPKNFVEVCKNSDGYAFKLLAHERSVEQSLEDVLPNSKNQRHLKSAKSGILCVGPEGGFTEQEVNLASEWGFSVIGLGIRRLRSETASLIGSALILDRMGELGASCQEHS